MKANEIKEHVLSGRKVYWSNELYEVVTDGLGDFLIECKVNKHCIGLTWKDGITLNGKEEDFYLSKNDCEPKSIG